jgi:hypothetical protein
MAYAIRHGLARVNEQEYGDVREEEDKEEEEGGFHDPGNEPPAEEAPRIAMLLKEESGKSLEKRLNGAFLDAVTEVAEVEICR